ncbi:IS630 family transposase (plasmid) [Streptomyces sp. JL4002]|uniref:IS630 family transposase n=1 Tax=Streptomyces sp. JL4002 TaxID=3404781 RepID=UPI003B2868DF
MRYPEGGGLTAERRAFREGIRLQAGMRFAAGEKTAVIAKELRVSVRSVERWRRAWREGGMEGLRSAGPANSPTVTDAQFAQLEEELGKGPSAHGFADERWTLARVQTMIRRRLRVSLSVATVWRLLKRHGWSWQAPARRALERDEHAVELWKKEVWPRVKASRRSAGPGSFFEDEAGFSMTPPRARTWGRRGQTPVIRVRGRSRRRTSVAALCCYKPGEKSRLIHRPRTHLLLKGARKSFSWKDYRDLLVRAHIQLGGPIVVVWDNLNTHLAAGLKRYEAEHDWLTTVRLPAYAPDLNPVEAVWSLVRRAMANTAFDTPDDLDRVLRRELRRIQLRPHLINGCLTATGLTLTLPTPP